MSESQDNSLHLTKFVCSSGALSRRRAAEAVKAGRVAIDGVVVTDPATPVPPAARVTLDGRPLQAAAVREYILLHKPRGYVCTNHDPHAARRAVDLIRLEPPVRLYSAGRLDADSEGMLIFSNDGDYVLRLTHPRYGVLKEYLVTTLSPLTARELNLLRRGIRDAGEFLRPETIVPLADGSYRFILNEGKKREIRRLVAFVDNRVTRLVRVRTGSLELGKLKPGQWRRLTSEEVAASLENPR